MSPGCAAHLQRRVLVLSRWPLRPRRETAHSVSRRGRGRVPPDHAALEGPLFSPGLFRGGAGFGQGRAGRDTVGAWRSGRGGHSPGTGRHRPGHPETTSTSEKKQRRSRLRVSSRPWPRAPPAPPLSPQPTRQRLEGRLRPVALDGGRPEPGLSCLYSWEGKARVLGPPAGARALRAPASGHAGPGHQKARVDW